MKWYVTGDCHGRFLRFENLEEYKSDEKANIICLGDFGINFYLTKTDVRNKQWLSEKYPNFTFYCVRGNHEARPLDVPSMEIWYDHNIKGFVFWEPKYPNIRYLRDYSEYWFGEYHVAVIGGAYSVDKWYRLQRAGIDNELNNNPKRTGWFSNEQLTPGEMEDAERVLGGKSFDFVLSHTCPLSYQPTDLFLGFVDQSKVDSTMEIWMDKLKDKFEWNIWCFGHYHADRIERPHVEQFFNDIDELDMVFERWEDYDQTGHVDWWLTKSPNFYMGV